MLRPDSYRQDIAGCAVQNPVGGRTEQQGQSVPTVAADHDHIGSFCFRRTLNLALRAPEDEVLMIGWYFQGCRKLDLEK